MVDPVEVIVSTELQDRGFRVKLRVTGQLATEDNAVGDSKWLFLGQMAASVGSILYSWLLHNWVFITTNSLILITALVGQWVMWRKRNSRDD